tara:strand:- start:2709 stop:3683 length:975 start_codon:yes stop_codon:yes gene_type:complete
MEESLQNAINKKKRKLQEDYDELKDINELHRIHPSKRMKSGLPLVEIWDGNAYTQDGWRRYKRELIGPYIGRVMGLHRLTTEKQLIGDKGTPFKGNISKNLCKDLHIKVFIGILNENTRSLTHVKFQSIIRGRKLRCFLLDPSDKYDFDILVDEIKYFNEGIKKTKRLNGLLSKKKKRIDNFPSSISENMVKFALSKKYKVMPCWDTKKGDLVINKGGLFIQCEIKAFQNGPTSFGGKEKWDWLYIVDATNTLEMKYKIYEIKLSNTNETFRSIKVNKTQTFGTFADTGKRPRVLFETIFQPQLGEHCKLIFDGHVSELYNDTT